MAKYRVTVWKTEAYRTEVEVEADTPEEAYYWSAHAAIDKDDWQWADTSVDPENAREVTNETA